MVTLQRRIQGQYAELFHRIKDGTEDLSDWDAEELLKGYRRDKNGNFVGRPPSVIPREIHDELARRVKNEVAHELRGLAHKHIAPVLEAILEGELQPEDVPALRLKAQVAQDLIDRFVVGRQEKVEISGTMRHEAVIANVTLDRDELPDPDDPDAEIIDAEVVEDDPVDDDEDWEF